MEKAPSQPSGEEQMGIPAFIRRAKAEGDTRLLSMAGRKGGLATASKRQLARVEDEMVRIALEEEHLSRRKEAGEDILPLSTYDA